MTMIKAQLKYELISSREMLNETIYFLEQGFDWGIDQSILLKKMIPILNARFEHYGVIIKAEQKIVGAILFFYQGSLFSNNKEKPIINFSSWYVDEKYRGLPTISLIKFILDEFKDSIITNYSANDTATKILLASGFQRMNLKRCSIFFYQSLFDFSKIRLRPISKKFIKFDNNYNFKLTEGKGINYFKAEIKNKHVQFITKNKVYKRSIFGVNFDMKTLFIIWSSDDALLAQNWKSISKKLFSITKTVKIIYDFKINELPKDSANISNNNFLIFNDGDNQAYIRPIQSELNLFK